MKIQQTEQTEHTAQRAFHAEHAGLGKQSALPSSELACAQGAAACADPAQAAIAVFDSGLGGLSVLSSLRNELPHEDFIYYGDSAFAPYGEKSANQVQERVDAILAFFFQWPIKALVIACNTATSLVAEELRARYPELPIVGMEPALKPAVEYALSASSARPVLGKSAAAGEHKAACSKVLVLATPNTIHFKKYQQLLKHYQDLQSQTQLITSPDVSGAPSAPSPALLEIINRPCPGLAAAIEKGDPDSQEVSDLLKDLLDDVHQQHQGEISAVVLGCTHYPFIAKQIRELLGEKIQIFDGRQGTARQLAHILTEKKLLNSSKHQGSVRLYSSSNNAGTLQLYNKFLSYESIG